MRTVSRQREVGRHEQVLDLDRLSNGVYILRLRAGGQVRTHKLTVVRKAAMLSGLPVPVPGVLLRALILLGALAGLLPPNVGAQQTPMVTTSVSVRTDAGDVQSLILGIDPEATSGIDTALGEEQRPPLPPSDVFDARLIDRDLSGVDLGTGTHVDVRPGAFGFTGTRRHELRIQPGSGVDSVTIAWTLPPGLTGTLTDEATGGAEVRVSLRGDGAVTLTDLGRSRYLVALDYDGPYVALMDGAVGRPYAPPDASPGSKGQPIGRFVLAADQSGATLEALTVQNQEAAADGVDAAELWRSSDPSFDAGDSSIARSVPSGRSVRFENVGLPVPRDSVYVFLVLDLTTTAQGRYAPVVPDEQALSLAGGMLAQVNDTAKSRFEAAALTREATSLPVELARFGGETTDGGARLRWRTAAEQNNAGFRLQRRIEDVGAGTWTKVHFVESKAAGGTSSEGHSYQFTDESVPFAADSVSYRLVQIDVGGSVVYSDPITLDRDTVQTLQLKAPYPNPVRHRVNVPFAVPEGTDGADVQIRLYDILGRRVETVKASVEPGRHKHTLEVDDLASGVYFLRLRAGDVSEIRKVTVVR